MQTILLLVVYDHLVAPFEHADNTIHFKSK